MQARSTVAACALALTVVGCTGQGGLTASTPTTAATPTSSSSSSPGALTSVSSKKLEQALTSGDSRTVRAVLAGPVADAWVAKPEQILPGGATLVIDPATATARGELLEVQATSRGGGKPEQRWVLTLVREGEDWKLLGTRAAP